MIGFSFILTISLNTVQTVNLNNPASLKFRSVMSCSICYWSVGSAAFVLLYVLIIVYLFT